ncbi:putative uncharacterized protein [Clostridium sp. CAG:411]|jgi:flagellar hook protein FlgE|nr:putative uncharacterized protein [Clostridium sp. CAG:411]
MMRSLYSGVAGLKTHQTRMDVIGNNIANVNTVGFKASSVNFSDVLYQTTQSASGANSATGVTGTNAKQIGLGTKVASITTSVDNTGGSQSTDRTLDCMIEGDAFFIVNYGGSNYFTKAGSFFVDGSGTLCTAAGASVMGWGVDTTGTDIVRDVVKPLTVMSAENMSSAPEATKNTYITGNVDATDKQLSSDNGVAMQVQFYDSLGNSYSLKLALKQAVDGNGQAIDGQYTVEPADILDEDGKSIFYTVKDDGTKELVTDSATTPLSFTLGGTTYTAKLTNGELKLTATGNGNTLTFNTSSGSFKSVGEGNTAGDSLTFTLGNNYTTAQGSPFTDVDIDFSTLTQYAGNGKCNMESQRGTKDASGTGAGRIMGEMIGLSIDNQGKIYGSYDNGTSKLLGQIAVTTFANATGLESVGNSMFATTQNSGDFDGIGKDITEAGGKINTSVLEMSNVDLSSEFTNMITTQRGFQANSRIITTSDTMLEELINLKR